MRELNESNAVEVTGICFETVVSERVLTIPDAKRGVYTSVELGIRIANNTQSFFTFHPLFTRCFQN